jgi:hypothetical protein
MGIQEPMIQLPPIVVTAERLDQGELGRLVRDGFGDMVKLVVDVRRRLVAAGGQLHADAEALLLEQGSAQDDLWGANYYPGRGPSECLEYTALINIRPAAGNRGMEIGDPAVRAVVHEIVAALVGEGEPL